MDSQHYTATQVSTAAHAVDSALNSTHTPHTLASLPNDVLLQVWTHLEDTQPLSRVNKRFNKLSQDTLWRAKWLMQRYPRYLVIFEAIARPKIFTPALLERLLHLGAPLSRNLVQLIQLEWNATVRSLRYDKDERIHWGRVSFTAYAALLQQASSLHGDGINVEPDELDSCVLARWQSLQDALRLDEREQRVAEALKSKVYSMFKEHSFIPLPLEIVRGYENGVDVWKQDEWIVSAAMYDCGLAPFIAKNGYVWSVSDTEELLDSWFYTQTAERATASAEHLKVDGVINISQAYAKRIFAPRRRRDEESERIRIATWKLLLQLDKTSALPFRLAEVIEELAASKSTAEKQSNVGSEREKAG